VSDLKLCRVYDGAGWIPIGVEIVGTPVDNQIAVWKGPNSIEGDSNLTFDGNTLSLSGNLEFPSRVLVTIGTIPFLTTGGEDVDNSTNFCGGLTSGNLLTSGTWNVMIGTLAGANVTTGYGNVFIGENAGTTLESGHDNICIGDADVSGAAVNNEINIGNVIKGTSSDLAIVGRILKVDHIAEYTASHGVVFDNSVEITGLTDSMIVYKHPTTNQLTSSVIRQLDQGSSEYSVNIATQYAFEVTVNNGTTKNMGFDVAYSSTTGFTFTDNVNSVVKIRTYPGKALLLSTYGPSYPVQTDRTFAVDHITEYTASHGVDIETLLIKDGYIDYPSTSIEIRCQTQRVFTYMIPTVGTLRLGYTAGNETMTGTNNILIGEDSGYFIGSGQGNVFVGSGTAIGVTGQGAYDYNIGIGVSALYSIITGATENVAVGRNAALYLTNGSYNVMVGSYAGAAAVSNQSVYIGSYSGRYSTYGSNTFIGAYSGQGVNGSTNGVNNIFIGHSTGDSFTTGSRNLLIGYQVDLTAATTSDQFRLGYDTTYLLEGSFATAAEWVGVNYNFRMKEITAPATPDSGYGYLYVKSADSKLYFKNDGGTEYNLTSEEVTPTDDILDWSTDKYVAYASAAAAGAAGKFYLGGSFVTAANLRLNYTGGLFVNSSTDVAIYATNAANADGAIKGESTSNNGLGVYGINNGNAGHGVYGINTSGGIGGGFYSSGSGIALYASIASSVTNSSGLLVLNRAISGSANGSGAIINISDTNTTSGTISGSILVATLESTVRINLNPRVTDGASAVAYILDTHNALSTTGAKLVAFKNQGTEKLFIDKDGYLGVPDGSVRHLQFYAGNASGAAGTDAGDITVRAGNAINADSGSTNGKVHIIPGNHHTAGNEAYVVIGDTNSNFGTIYMQVGNGTQTNINLQLLAKGSGSALTVGGIGGQIGTFVIEAVSTQPRGDVTFGNGRDAEIVGCPGSTTGYYLKVRGGVGASGNNNGGNLYLQGGTPTGTGIRGLVYVKGNLYPEDDDTYYLGKNSISTPLAWKALILKDTTNGNYYRITVVSGTITATQIT
jgi:hypothetical protein